MVYREMKAFVHSDTRYLLLDINHPSVLPEIAMKPEKQICEFIGDSFSLPCIV